MSKTGGVPDSHFAAREYSAGVRDGRSNSAPRDRGLATLGVAALATSVIVYWWLVVSIQSQYRLEPWITGDWLINYSAGFVRRGLVGEIVRRLYQTADVNPVSAILGIKGGLYAAISIGLLFIALRRRFDVFDFALVMCPAGLPFELYAILGSGRKEIALLAAFVFYVALDVLTPITTGGLSRRWQFWFFSLALPLLTSVHEALLFFFPFFLTYRWLRTDNFAADVRAMRFPCIAAGCVFVLSYLFRGNDTAVATICSSVTAMSLDHRLCAGAIEALGRYDVHIRGVDALRFIFLATLSFAPLAWYAAQTLTKTDRRKFFTGASVSIVATLPLYVVSEDWGRWIHISWILMFVTLLAFKTIPLRLRTTSRSLKAAYAVTIILYVFSWRIPHWIHSDLPIFWKPDFTLLRAGHRE